MWYTVSTCSYAWYFIDCSFEVVLIWASTGKSYSHQFSWISMMLLIPVQWYLCILDTLMAFISVLIIKVNLYVKIPFVTINKSVWIMQVSLFSSAQLTGFTVATQYLSIEWNDCVNRDNGWSWFPWLWSFCGYYSSAFAVTVCTCFILHNIIALQLGQLYVITLHGFYVSKNIIFSNWSISWITS